jgi:hypothetical protein
MCAGVTHPVTGETITKYKKLAMPGLLLAKKLVIKHKAIT